MRADLLVRNALLVATVDSTRRELPGGWVAITNGLISGVGSSLDTPPEATEVIDASNCLVTPGHACVPTNDECATVWLAANVVPIVASY
jgi:cytosine/adenosine deaminase-related metal-dependent hydrolase